MDKSEIKITKNDVLKGISGRTYLDDITFDGKDCFPEAFHEYNVSGSVCDFFNEELDFGEHVFDKCVFKSMDLRKWHLRSASFYSCYFEDCLFSKDLERITVNNCQFKNMDFSGSNVENLSFYGCKFEDVSFASSEISSCNFSECILERCSFEKIRQDCKNVFQKCSFTGINFPISLAVMASSCVPFAFNPIRMPEKFRKNKISKLPLLVDGGLYDNQGVHEISEQSSEHYFTKYAIVSNAGNTDLNDKKIWNIVKLLIKTSDILMKRIEKLQSRKIMFSSSNVESRFAYLSLTWDATDRLVRGFVWNIAKGLVPAEVYQEHGIEEEEAESMRKHYHASKGYKSDDVERLMQKVKNSIGWDSLEHLRPNEKEVIIARNVCTGLDGLSKKKVYCLQKFSEWMTIVQVRMYLPNLLN